MAAIETTTDVALAPLIAELAAATFPLACPPHSAPEDVAGFIRINLGVTNFEGYLESPDSDVIVARSGDGADAVLLGYSLVHHLAPTDPDVTEVVTQRPVSEISKMYVLPDHHGLVGCEEPLSHRLMRAAVEAATAHGSVLAWLGVNQENVRAQRFYTKMGFRRAGTKMFGLNGSVEHDFVMTRPL